MYRLYRMRMMVLNYRKVDVVAMAKKLGELDSQQTANADKQNKEPIGTVPTKVKLAERIILTFNFFILEVTKGCGVAATTIEGQNAFASALCFS